MNDSDYFHLGYATLSQRQLDYLLNLVKGKVVVDLGAGNLELAAKLAETAEFVYAVDSKPTMGYAKAKNMLSITSYFDSIPVIDADIAIISWPSNNESASSGLISLLPKYATVAYIGLNDGQTTMCGTPKLWRYLTMRQLVCELQDRNNLLTYSNEARSTGFTMEEVNGLYAYG